MIDSKHLKNNIPSSKLLEVPQEFGWGLSDDMTTPTSGLTEVDRFTNKFKCSDVRISLSTGDTSNIIYVDIHKNDVSIFDTQVSIDISGSTSVSATTPFIFSLSANTVTFIDDEEVKFYVSGATDCTGLKVKLIGDKVNYDEDAQLFIDAVTTLTVTQEKAIDNLVIGLKNNGTWDKYYVIYPIIGRTASSHKWNLKDPRDLDAAFRLTYTGTTSHSSLGVSTSVGGFAANTNFNPVTESLSATSTHASVYIQTDPGNLSTFLSSGEQTANSLLLGQFQGGARTLGQVASLTNADYAPDSGTVTSDGYISISTNGNRDAQNYINGAANGSTNDQNGSFSDLNVYLGAQVNSVDSRWEYTDDISYAAISDGLSATEITNDYTVIQAYQTALGRQV